MLEMGADVSEFRLVLNKSERRPNPACCVREAVIFVARRSHPRPNRPADRSTDRPPIIQPPTNPTARPSDRPLSTGRSTARPLDRLTARPPDISADRLTGPPASLNARPKVQPSSGFPNFGEGSDVGKPGSRVSRRSGRQTGSGSLKPVTSPRPEP